MTHNQINYWNYIENKRHNIISETIAQDTLSEQKRHARVTERIDQQNADTNVFNALEGARHNRETEQIGWSTLNETIRHNVRSEELTLETAQIHANATVAAATINAGATRYAAQVNAAASRYASDKQYMSNYVANKIANDRVINDYNVRHEANVLGAVTSIFGGLTNAAKVGAAFI